MHRTLELTGALCALVSAAWATPIAAQAPTRNCTEDEASFIEEQVREADYLLARVGADLQALQGGEESSSFDYWFGNHEPAQLERVTSKFLTMREVANEAIYDCACDLTQELLDDGYTEANTMAWVNPFARERSVHLCPLFFEKDPSEFGAGTLIHEYAHYAGAADSAQWCVEDPVTKHHPEWAEASRMLAIHDPEQAAYNADSYRLYALDWDPARPSAWPCDESPKH